jgi:predicted AAA+ superfamily ATPase
MIVRTATEKIADRKIYTDEIKGFIDKDLIKVIIGVRRSGKSEILNLIKQEVSERTDKEHIIFVNFEDSDYEWIVTHKELNSYIAEKMKDDKRYYIFLDEIQEVKNWERSVNSLRLKNTDIYITGSNSKLLSGELATLISGRYVEFEVNTLSFAEFKQFRKEFGIEKDDIDEYIIMGGFPLLSASPFTESQARRVVIDVHSSAVLKDVVSRNKVKNVPLLERIISFIYDNVGNLVSIRKVADYLKSNGGGGDFETVSNYIGYLESACIIRKASRYDIKGKKLLESNDKYYLAEHSLQYAVRDRKRTNLPGILENIVYNELRRRGYNVYVGKVGTREIDFVAETIGGGKKVYVQVCTEYSSAETMEREFSPLIEIKDHYPKYVVTLDKYWEEEREGVMSIHLSDFLLKEAL